MTFVVTDNCIKCKYMDCVEVCPVDCFYEGENMLVIHPDECIDCGGANRNARPTPFSPTPTPVLRAGSNSTRNMRLLAQHRGQARPSRRCQRVRRRSQQARAVLLAKSRSGRRDE